MNYSIATHGRIVQGTIISDLHSTKPLDSMKIMSSTVTPLRRGPKNYCMWTTWGSRVCGELAGLIGETDLMESVEYEAKKLVPLPVSVKFFGRKLTESEIYSIEVPIQHKERIDKVLAYLEKCHY